MDRLKHHWYRVPATVRKPFVLIIGLLFCIASVLTGWLPGPGGIPLFLIGIAILATEFAWAQRVRDRALAIVHKLGVLWRQHKIIGTALIVLAAVTIALVSYATYVFLR